MRTLRYGGTLEFGDFIAVAYNNCVYFGWYCGNGINDTLQYYSLWQPAYHYERYERRAVSNPGEKFTLKGMYKSYINSVHSNRVVKISNPEEIFTEKDERDGYEASKEALIKLNFIKH